MASKQRGLLSDASGAVADLGVLIPIVAALVLKNGLSAGTVLVGVGALYLAAGAYFRVPVPVQPIKAAAAIAIARDLSPATLSAAGLLLGAVLIVLGLTGGAALLDRVFTKPIVRGIQLGVGLILVRAAFHLSKTGPTRMQIVVGMAIASGLILVSRKAAQPRLPVPLLIVGAGVVWTVFARHVSIPLHASFWHPQLSSAVFHPATLWSAFTLLVIPQIPLTFGNAVVALTDLEHRYYGTKASRVSAGSVSLSCGIANVAVGALGGMPMCHGSGGLTAHYRAGARTVRMNIIVGGVLLVLGLVLGSTALGILGLIPPAVLMGFLVFTGALHAGLTADLRGYDLIVACAMGALGFATSNLAFALALGLVMVWPVRVARTALRRA